MTEKKIFDLVMRAALHTVASVTVFSSSALAQTKADAPEPLQGNAEQKETHLKGGAEQKETHLKGSAETKTQGVAPLEGKLEQTAPLESELSDEQLKLQALQNALLDNAPNLSGQADKDGKRKPLEGRLEQIGTPNAKLPIELTTQVNKNKAFADIQLVEETAHMDVMPEPKILEANVTQLATMASFPDFIVGTWGGHLKVLTRYLPNPEVSDPHIVVDDIGTVIVRFVKEGDRRVTVVPPSAFFERRSVDREHHVFRKDADFGVKEDLKPDTYNDYPIIHMGSQRWHNAIGGRWEDNVVHHSLQRIGKKGAEQDTVFERTRDGAPYGYRETIVRYTWVRKRKIFMQAAVVDFQQDRTVRKRTTMEGFIVPAWHPYAEEIASIAALKWEEVNKIYNLDIDW